MNFTKSCVLKFFEGSKVSYEIPVYQRAYSWDEKNWQEFLADLMEQIEGDNNYFFGNILVEVIKKNKLYEIIDGQQRVTTLTIFIRSLLNVLLSRPDLVKLDKDFDLEEKEKIFLKSGGSIKLRPVEYDRICFDTLIIDNIDKFECYTPSQEKMKAAKVYFTTKLSLLSTQTIITLLEKVEDTDLTIIELEGKKDAALMFELENNRGKDLTNMEKVKSYFMYQMYVNSPSDEVEMNIVSVSETFKRIYQVINTISKVNEDSILIYHNNAYIKGFSYRTLEDLKEVFKKSVNKVEWINDYVRELLNSFTNINKFLNSDNKYVQDLMKLGIPAYIYPFIIRGYKYQKYDESLAPFFRILEVITFRSKLINSRANIQERLNDILLSYEGNVELFREKVRVKLNESWYWGDSNTKNYLNAAMYGNNVLNFVLWRYENHIQNKGYGIKDFSIKNEQIEHISPQTPTNGDFIESGYDVDENKQYLEEFAYECLHCLGNLVLISGSHNASIGNKPFKDKLTSYMKNPLLNQQTEIQEFVEYNGDAPLWKASSIQRRKIKIVEFALKEWCF